MIDKLPVNTSETEIEKVAERPPEYGQLEATIQDLIIGNDQETPMPQYDEGGRITALKYRIFPNRPGEGSVLGFNFAVRIPENPEEVTHIAMYDGFTPRPEWEWDMGADTINGDKLTGELTPERARRISGLVENSDYNRERKGLVAPKQPNPIMRWLRSRR